jgi:hemerythrin-like domain-containing protein
MLLKDDHQKVKALFREFEAAGERAFKTKARIAQRAFAELEAHTAIEEEIFYPAVEARTDSAGKELVAEGVEEHHVVDMLIQEMKELSPEDEQFDAKFKVLTENVEHHIEEEESELLPDAERRLGDELRSLGERMSRRKAELRGAAHARA